MRRTRLMNAALVCALTFFVFSAVVAAGHRSSTSSAAPTSSLERGAYLVRIMSCHDCHTPWKMGPRGPEPDMSRALIGHPASMQMPQAPALGEAWGWAGAATNTAFAGPWGVSFAANLTPDKETGLGSWTEEMFVATMKTGRHLGKGRPVLPPMPYSSLGALSDSDIHDLFTYLRSLTPIPNRVPAPIDAPERLSQ